MQLRIGSRLSRVSSRRAIIRAQQAGRYVRGAGRDGDRTSQIVLRLRLVRLLRAAIAHYAPGGWMELADGSASRLILAPL